MNRRKPDSDHVNLAVDMDPTIETGNGKCPPISMPPSPRLNINRVAYSVRDFHEKFETREQVKNTLMYKAFQHFRGSISCSTRQFFKSSFPIVDWLGNYNFKQWLLADIVAGVTVAIFQAPQSMGYSLIAHVPPVYGLYTALFPMIMYTIFGTSRHSSIGAFAIVSAVLTGNVIVQVLESHGVTLAQVEAAQSSNEPSTLPINFTTYEVAAAISFVMGIVMPLAAFLRLGFISIYLSDQFLSGYTTASSLYIFTSQLRNLIGVNLPYRSGYFAILYTIYDVVISWRQFNIACLTISIVAMAILLFSKIYVNKWLSKHGIQIPFPIELLVVIGATVISYFFDFNEKYQVPIVGYIRAGIPAPQMPRLSLMKIVALRSLTLALVGFTITLSIGKGYGRKHGYQPVPNQELFAIGASNLFGSLFSCLPSAASLPRSATQEAAGGKTQLVSIINCIIIYLMLMYLSPLLDQLPKCILASIIAVALRGLLAESRQFHLYWKISKLDGAVWMLTFLSVIILDVDFGLYFSLACSLLILIYKSARPKTYLLGPINGSDVYVPAKKYVDANSIKGIKIYQFGGPLHYASLEFFRSDMMKKIGVNLSELFELRKTQFPETQRRTKKEIPSLDSQIQLMSNPNWAKVLDNCRIVIVDCSMVSYIDSNGVTGLKLTAQEFGRVGIRFFLSGCAPHVIQMLSRDNFFQEVGQNNVFITVHDAVLVAKSYLGTNSFQSKVQPGQLKSHIET